MFFKFYLFISTSLLLCCLPLTQNHGFAASCGSERGDCGSECDEYGLECDDRKPPRFMNDVAPDYGSRNVFRGTMGVGFKCGNRKLLETSSCATTCTTTEGSGDEGEELKNNLPREYPKPPLKIPPFFQKSFFSLEGVRPVVIRVGIIGGGGQGATIASILSNMSGEFRNVILKIYMFERLDEILKGATQTAVMLHAGGGEYVEDPETVAHCQMAGSTQMAMYPKLYAGKTQSAVFAKHPTSNISPWTRKRTRREAKEIREDLENVSPERLDIDSQIDISPEVMEKTFPKLSGAVVSRNDVLMKIAERDVLLKKCIYNSKNIESIINYTVSSILKSEDGLFEITGCWQDRKEPGRHVIMPEKYGIKFNHIFVTAWDESKNILDASFSCADASVVDQPSVASEVFFADTALGGFPIEDMHVSFDSMSGKVLADESASCASKQAGTILSDFMAEDRILALCDIRCVASAKKTAIFTLTGGAMLVPINEDIGSAYLCLEKASYPKVGEKEIHPEDVLSHGQLIVDGLKETFGLDGIKLAGAIKKVIVRRSGDSLHKRSYEPPVVTPEGVIVAIPPKATFFGVLALQSIEQLLMQLPNTCGEFIEIKERWIPEIQKIVPNNRCLHTDAPLPEEFKIGMNEDISPADVLIENLSFIKSFELTSEGEDIYQFYKNESDRVQSLLQRSSSVNAGWDRPTGQNDSRFPSGIQRARSDPYEYIASKPPSYIELAVSNSGSLKRINDGCKYFVS